MKHEIQRQAKAMRDGRRWQRVVVAALLGLTAMTLALVAQRDTGLVRDEIVYMNTGRRYATWWADYLRGNEQVSSASHIVDTFGGTLGGPSNPEHPPLMKLLYGVSEWLVHGAAPGPGHVAAARAPNAVMLGLLVAMVVLFGGQLWGLAVGAISGALMLLMPRMLFHASIATFDAPVVTMWFACIYAYHAAIALGISGIRQCCTIVVLGVTFGLMLGTKHNAILLPVVFAVHYTWVVWRRQQALGGGRSSVVRMAASVVRGLFTFRPGLAVAFVVIGPLVLVAMWPLLWIDPFANVRAWLAFHFAHVHYNFEYLGRNWNAPPFPWHVALVTTALTVPVATWVAACVGAVVLAARAKATKATQHPDPQRSPVLLLTLSAAVAIGPFFLRTTPIFGGEKHWSPILPTLCIFAGVGVVTLARRVVVTIWPCDVTPVRTALTTSALAGFVCFAAAAETAAAHPYALSHYNALAGGAPGGADLGMNRQFWGYAARGVLAWLNERAPARVYVHDASPAWTTYQREQLLDPKVTDAGHEQVGIRRSDYALVIHERHFNRHDYLIWQSYGTVQPAYVLRYQGVPIVSVYARNP